MIRAIAFDMDGVIIDSHPVHRRAWRKFLATVGVAVTDEELEFILEGRRREEILRHFLGDIPLCTIEEYGHRKDQFFQEDFDEITLLPGVREFLKIIAGSGMASAVATSASHSRTWGTLRRLGLGNHFAAVVTGDDVAQGKPDPAVYLLTARRLQVDPKHVLVLEDAACGVVAATGAGMKCVGVSSNGRADALRRSGAEFIIPDFRDSSIERLLQFSST